MTFILQKAKCVGIEGEGKTAVVKLAVMADVHCSVQSLIQGDVSTETCHPSDPQVPEGQEVVDAAETPQATGTTETAPSSTMTKTTETSEVMVTSSKTAELGIGA